MKILIATNNLHKIDEIKKIVNEENITNVDFIGANELELNIHPEETAETFEGNAEIKAIAFYKATKIPTIADDSGLEIEALNNLPGVYSARFYFLNNSQIVDVDKENIDKLNREKVLKLLDNHKNRKAKFRTAIAFYNGISTQFFIGECRGSITYEEYGKNGFGYDSIFVPDGYKQTFAEMQDITKNKISHRYKAIMNFITNYLSTNK